MHTIVKLLLTAMMLWTAARAIAQMPDERLYHQLADFPFVIVSDTYQATPPYISDSLFNAAARGIHFQVNRTELQPTDPFIRLYREQLLPWLKQQDMELRQVVVKGAASPEGSYQNNVRLSRERTRRLIDFLNTDLDSRADGLSHTVSAASVTEDYARLAAIMREAGDTDARRVDSIWQSCRGDELRCKKLLKALDGGRLWRRMLREYFPRLRQARVLLWFTKKRLATANIVMMPPDTTDFSLQLPEKLWLTVCTCPDTIRTPLVHTRRHLVAVRTNLLHDLLYVPQFGWAPGGNIQLEYYPLRGHYTINAGYTHITHRHWNEHKFFQLRDLQIELRRYFRGGGTFLGSYLGLYAEGTKYGIGFSKTKGWEGEGGGGGLTAGYTCRLNRKGNLRLELSASLGFFYTHHDPYVYGNTLTGKEDGLYYYKYYGNTSDFRERNHRFTWLGPTNAGVHITYDIIYRKKKYVSGLRQEGGCL